MLLVTPPWTLTCLHWDLRAPERVPNEHKISYKFSFFSSPPPPCLSFARSLSSPRDAYLPLMSAALCGYQGQSKGNEIPSFQGWPEVTFQTPPPDGSSGKVERASEGRPGTECLCCRKAACGCYSVSEWGPGASSPTQLGSSGKLLEGLNEVCVM